MLPLRLAAVLLLLSTAAAFGAAPEPIKSSTRIRTDGIGAIEIGMTLAEAAQATGMTFTDPGKYQATDDAKSCTYVDLVGGPRDVSFMVLNGEIARIDLGPRASNRTLEGLGIGASEDAIRHIYSDAKITVEPSFYGGADHGREFTVEFPDSTDMHYFFATDLKKINGMRVGRKDAVEYVEGCL
jgi:hypothetical protein